LSSQLNIRSGFNLKTMYSATIHANPYFYAAKFGAAVCHEAFLQMFLRRSLDQRMHVPTEVEQAFLATTDVELEPMRALLMGDRLKQMRAMLDRAAALARRLACANDAGSAGSADRRTVLRAQADLRVRQHHLARGGSPLGLARVFPGSYAPVLLIRDGRLEVRPMRYKCRPANADASSDRRLTSSHHISRATLPGTWRDHFGSTHAVIALNALYDVVSAQRLENGRSTAAQPSVASAQIRYTALAEEPLFAACLWSHWQGEGREDLWSFGTLTRWAVPDPAASLEKPDIVLLRRDDVRAWLEPTHGDLCGSTALLEKEFHTRMQHARADPDEERRARRDPSLTP
jgi:putative SOS response-associated peptidase YedK